MKDTTHTPGPWIADRGIVYGPFACIAGTDFGHSQTTPRLEAEANARLIAAAPELLTALKNALGSLEACALILKPRTDRARLSADIAAAEQAIAKAEGK